MYIYIFTLLFKISLLFIILVRRVVSICCRTKINITVTSETLAAVTIWNAFIKEKFSDVIFQIVLPLLSPSSTVMHFMSSGQTLVMMSGFTPPYSRHPFMIL